MAQAFDPTQYTLSLTGLGPLIVGVLSAALGIAVLVRERRSPVSITFGLFTTSVAIWLLAFTAAYSTDDEALARWWVKVAHLGVVFIPSFVTIFTLAILDRLEERRAWAWGSLALSGLFFAGMAGTDWFIAGVRRFSWGFYPKYGLLSVPFLLFFFGAMVGNLRAYWVESRRSVPGVRQERLKGLLLAFSIGYLGSVDFLPAYGIPLYPCGYLPVLGFVVLMARAISRYHLMDVTPALAANLIIQTMSEALFVLDHEGRIRIVNQAACRLFARTEAELLGLPIVAAAGSLFKPELLERLLRSDLVQEQEVLLPTGHGSIEALSLTTSSLRNEALEPVATVCVARDVTRRKRAEESLHQTEEQLRQAQRLESMGQFAGAIAQEFNQLLSVVARNSVYLLSGLGKQEHLRKPLEELKHAADQAAKLTQHLLAFSSSQSLKPRVLDLNAIITGLRGVVQWMVGKEIELVTVLDPALGWVKADPAQVELIIMNLMAHARDAMPRGGTLTVKTANMNVDAPIAGVHGTVAPGDYALLDVRDTGDGVAEEDIPRLFEPFFTARGENKESGLGLATVYGAIKQTGGSIVVTSKRGQGTSLKVYLPLAK